MLSRLTLPESVDACRMPRCDVPAPSATVTDAVDQVSHDPVTGSVSAAPPHVHCGDSVRVTDWPSPPCALATAPVAGMNRRSDRDTSWARRTGAVKPAASEPVKFVVCTRGRRATQQAVLRLAWRVETQ